MARNPFEVEQPHFLRSLGGKEEYCGGTQPPTRVLFDRESQSVVVEVFSDANQVHGGVNDAPSYRGEFGMTEKPQDIAKPVQDNLVRGYALLGIGACATNAGLTLRNQ